MTVDGASDLEHRLSKVLDVAKTTVQVLLSEHSTPLPEAEEPQPGKILSETALLLLFASRIDEAHARIHKQVRALAEQLIPHARSEEVLAAITLAPDLARECAAAHLCLSHLGYPDADFDSLLARSLEAARRRERVPYRQLELEWLGGLWDTSGRVGSTRSDPSLAASTTAGLGIDPINPGRDDVYAFTHSLIYITDFGRQDRLPRARGKLIADAESALARCLDEDDFDLSGEVLLTWPLLCVRWSAASSFAFRVLTRVEDEVGFLPSLSLSEERYRELVGAARQRYTIAAAYHTVYVMGLLCAAMLQSRWAVPAPRAVRRVTNIADELDAHLVAKDRESQWERDYFSLPTRQRDALAPFLADVVLQRAIFACDFERVRAVLTLCVERDIKPSMAMTQAADLLRRFASSPFARSR